MAQADGRNPKLFTRIDHETRDRCQAVADELYDGNVALLVRIAVKRFLAELDPKTVDIDEREPQAAVA